jgi:hypothetical protein
MHQPFHQRPGTTRAQSDTTMLVELEEHFD